MIELEFSDEQIKQLHKLQQHLHPLVRARALALLLKNKGMAHHDIASIVGVCENTLRDYFNRYQQGGVVSLTVIAFRKPESQLVPFETVIRKYFETTPPATMAQACVELEKLINIPLKIEALRRYAKKLGLKHRKVGTVPAKADIEQQQKFHDEELQPRLAEAQQGKRAVYFVDAAHFVLGAFLAFLWSFKRLFVKTPSGRQRFNVLGALDAVTKKLITVTNDPISPPFKFANY